MSDDTVDTGQAVTVGDAVFKFFADSTNLEAGFKRIEDMAATSTGKAAASVGELGDAVDAVGQSATTAAPAVEQFGEKGAEAGQKLEYSFREAREGMMLTEETLGVRLPRALNSLLAHIPMVGIAFEAMLPIVGVLAAIDVIAKLVEKHEGLAKAQQRAALETENLAIKEADQTKSMELANLKLDDQIAKLEGRPEQNKLKEALLETAIAADNLATKFAADFEKVDEALDSTTGWLGRLMQDMYSWKDVLLANPEQFAAAWHKMTSGTKDVAAALDTVHYQLIAINKLRAQSSEGKSEDQQVEQQKTLAAAYEVMGQKAKAALDVVQAQAPENTKAIEQLSSMVVSAAAAQVDAGKTIENIHLRVKDVALQTAAAAAAAQEKAAKQALEAQLAAIDTWKSAQHAASLTAAHGAATWAVAEVQATDAAAIAHESYLQKMLAAATRSGDALKIQAAQQELVTYQTKSAAEETDKLAAAEQRHVEAAHKVVQEYAHLVDAGVAKQFEETAKAAEKLTAAEEELSQAQTKLTTDKIAQTFKDQEDAIIKLAKFNLISEEQKDVRLEALRKQEGDQALAALNSQLSREETTVSIALDKLLALTAGKGNPLFSDAQLGDLRKNLAAATSAYASAESAVHAAQEKVEAATGNPLFTPAQLADLKAKLSEAQAVYTKALADIHAAQAKAQSSANTPFLTSAQVGELKKNLADATAAYSKADADVQALHKVATSNPFFTAAQLADFKQKLAEAEATYKAAQAVLEAARKKSNDNPFIPNAEVEEAKANADRALAVVTKTQGDIVQTTEKFNKEGEANDKSHYEKMLLVAESYAMKVTASDRRLLEEQLKNTQAEIKTAQEQAAAAKSRGTDTTAIDQQIKALQNLEAQKKRELADDKISLAQLLQETHTQLLVAQNELAEAKARGMNTTAIENEIKQLKLLETQLEKAPKATSQLNSAMMELKSTMQSAASTMLNSLSTAMAGVIKGQESFGKAMEKGTLQMLGQMAQHWAEYFIGLGIADFAPGPTFDPAAGAGMFAAAAALEVLSGAMSGLSSGGSGSGSGTQSGAPSPGQTTSSSAGGGTTQTGSVTRLAEGGIVSKPTMMSPNVMVGDSPAGGAAEEAILPLSNPDAMKQIAKAIAPGGQPDAIPESGFDSGAVEQMTKAISSLTGTRDASQEFHFAEPGTGEKAGFQFDGSTSKADKPSFTAGSAPSPSDKPTFSSDRASASEAAGFTFGAPTPSVHDSSGFSSGEPSPGEKSAFSSSGPSESEKADFLSSQPTVGAKPGFSAGSPTVGEALGFKFDTPYPGDKPVFSSSQPSAPEKPGFSLASPSANDQRDFSASSPTVGDALGFSFSAPRLSHEGLGFTSGQPSSTATPGFSSGVPSPSEKPTLDIAQPSAGERPGFNYSAPSMPREMPDMESIAAQFGGLLSQPTLRAASDAQVPTAAVSSASSAQPMDIEGRMERFAEKMGAQSNPDNHPAVGDTTHIHVKGLMDSGNLKKLIKKQNLLVKNRQVTVNASNSLRVTRRSQ